MLLSDDIDHLEQYIALEKIRFSDTLKVEFPKNIDHQNTLIPPMLLLPFVENVLKHGSIVDDFLQVSIDISVVNNTLDFSVKNSHKYAPAKKRLRDKK